MGLAFSALGLLGIVSRASGPDLRAQQREEAGPFYAACRVEGRDACWLCAPSAAELRQAADKDPLETLGGDAEKAETKQARSCLARRGLAS